MSFVTPNGKEIKIVQIKNTALYGIQFGTGGELPDELCGWFTSPMEAKKKIDAYIARKEKESNKVKTNGKTAIQSSNG